MIGYNLFMKPYPNPTKHMLWYYIYLTLYMYYDIILFQITTVEKKGNYKLHIWLKFVEWVSEWLLFNAKWAFLQVYHGESNVYSMR